MLRRHWLVGVVLVAATALRIATAIAYWPALMFDDSWSYLSLSETGSPVSFTWDRPSGYPLLMDLLAVGDDKLVPVTLFQQAAGLTTAGLVYALLVRFGVGRGLAAAATAVVALDAYAIAIEERIMPEAFFTLALVVSFALTVWSRGRTGWLVAGGLVLGAAVSVRTAALFAIPVWLLYVVITTRAWRPALVAAVAVALPVLAYAAAYSASTGERGLGGADGWFLYGRIGEIGECGDADIPPETRPLCDRPAYVEGKGAGFFVWSARSPARHLFGGMGPDWPAQRRSNELLQQHAMAIIRDRPLRYAGLVAADFARFFVPGVMTPGASDRAISLPTEPHPRSLNRAANEQFIPEYRAKALPPDTVLNAYSKWVHTPRWLIGLLALASLAAVVLWLARRRVPHGPEILLFAGAGLIMLLGSAATSEMVVRYLLPSVPLIVVAGALAVTGLVTLARRPAGRATARAGRAPARPA